MPSSLIRRYAILSAVVAVSAVITGCGQKVEHTFSDLSPSGDLTKVTLMLNWYPEAEHGGYFAALVHGYYREAGLDVEIMPGGPNAPVVQQVARGAIPFGVTNADRILLARAEDANVKALMAPLQNSPRCLLVHASSGIEQFEQIKNVTLMMGREHAWAKYLIQNLSLEGVKIVPNTASLAPFLADPQSVKQGYVISEPFVAAEQGGDVKPLMVADLGFNPYTSVIIANDDLIDSDPELVRAFVQASLRGWQTYLSEPERTHGEIHRRNREMSLDILAYGVAALRQHCLAQPPPPSNEVVKAPRSLVTGEMDAGRWTQLIEQMEQLEMLDAGAVTGEQAFTTRFLDARVRQP